MGFPLVQATLYESDFDLSNLDISKHKFFKNFPDLSRHPKANIWDHIDQHFQKKLAVAKYFGRLLFGTPQDNEVVKIEFDPNFGHAWRPYYQRRYGYRGENFIKQIGKGHSPVRQQRSMSYKRERAGDSESYSTTYIPLVKRSKMGS
ncbi:uncharacterized protein LOC129606454 [Condylostylus longicornis]|uniref:uncharacterized protein LOC129606454 n=1 Tax=Condylostylus longicornis TaxID=2530218 RepID=UPI00244E1B1D|nr:uncharacterized protein LOC129606454 [Condylostylus longicornis]